MKLKIKYDELKNAYQNYSSNISSLTSEEKNYQNDINTSRNLYNKFISTTDYLTKSDQMLKDSYSYLLAACNNSTNYGLDFTKLNYEEKKFYTYFKLLHDKMKGAEGIVTSTKPKGKKKKKKKKVKTTVKKTDSKRTGGKKTQREKLKILALKRERKLKRLAALALKEKKKKTGAKKTRKATQIKGKASKLVKYAKQFLGHPYVWGGTSLLNGTDCSGFTMSIYKHFGYNLQRSSAAQGTDSRYRNVPINQIKVGDLVCYYGHVAIYIGNGKIIHASNRKDGIKISNNFRYRSIRCIKRIIS